MLSGIEIAGLVLGAFPIAINLLDIYRQDLRGPYSDWWRFESRHKAFLHQLDVERTTFKQCTRALLWLVVDDPNELEAFLLEPLTNGAKAKDFDASLQKRLSPESYRIYLSVLMAMQDDVDALNHGLGAGESMADLSVLGEKSILKHHIKRLKFCLYKKEGDRILKRLNESNNRLKTIIDDNDKLEKIQEQRRHDKGGIAEFLKRVQDYAASLFDVLSKRWKCNCTSKHQSSLLLEQRPKGALDNARTAPNEVVKFAVTVNRLDTTQQNGQTLCQSILISTLPNDAVVTADLNCNSPGMAFSATLQSYSKQGKGKAQLAGGKSVSFHQQSQPHQSYKKPQTHQKDKILQSTLQNQQKNAVLIVDAKREVTCLCEELKNQNIHKHSVQTLIYDSKRQGFKLTFPQPDTLKPIPIRIKLSDILSVSTQPLAVGSLPKLNLEQRMRLAMVIASSVLQLNSTPWLRKSLTAGDILFIAKDPATQSIDVTKPFIADSFPTTLEPSHVDSEDILFQLGIVLLELCFGALLEDQPFRSDYFGPGGTPNDFTDRAAAEHWMKDVKGLVGWKYAEATKRCIKCSFVAVADLNDTKFRQEVYSTVVDPIQETVEYLWVSA